MATAEAALRSHIDSTMGQNALSGSDTCPVCQQEVDDAQKGVVRAARASQERTLSAALAKSRSDAAEAVASLQHAGQHRQAAQAQSAAARSQLNVRPRSHGQGHCLQRVSVLRVTAAALPLWAVLQEHLQRAEADSRAKLHAWQEQEAQRAADAQVWQAAGQALSVEVALSEHDLAAIPLELASQQSGTPVATTQVRRVEHRPACVLCLRVFHLFAGPHAVRTHVPDDDQEERAGGDSRVVASGGCSLHCCPASGGGGSASVDAPERRRRAGNRCCACCKATPR